MIRALAAVAAASVLLAPFVAAASPHLSPSLATVLAEPPASEFVPEAGFLTALQGDFDAVDYVAILSANKPAQTLSTLKSDGFVAGYGRSWVQNRTNHLLLEAVIAFSGAAGAKRWLPDARTLDQNGGFFSSTFSLAGIDTQFGDHFSNPAGPAYADSAGFVKGNDYFFVYMFSRKDDLVDGVARQARQQYDIAPAGTIPPAQWPENASNNSVAGNLGAVGVAAGAVASLVIGLLVGLVVVLVIQRRRRRPAATGAGASIQMSADGHYWWDGQAWRDATTSAPPGAQRSADGHYWWDGTKWRPISTPN